MFHKEGSCVVVVSTGSSQGSGNKANSNNKGKAGNKTNNNNNNNNNSKGKAGKGGKAQQPNTEESSVSRAVDVPLRKSDRRRLRERATAYFLGPMNDATDTNSNSNSNSNESVSENENEDESFPNHNPLEGLLDAIFSKGGTISSRSLPAPKSTTTIPRAGTTKGNHESLILYVKSPNNDHYNDSNNDSNNNNNNNNNDETWSWPYRHKAQFVWMALEDKKSGRVLLESPTLALLAVLWHSIDFFQAHPLLLDHLRATRIVEVPCPVSRYLCRGADLMRAGIRLAPSRRGGDSLGDTKADGHQNGKGKPKGRDKGKGKGKGNAKKDDPMKASENMVLICVQGNPQPFAVGRSILYSNTNDGNAYGPGTKGIGVEVWSCYGDDLWRTTTAATSSLRASHSSSTANAGTCSSLALEDGSYGNAGFGRTPGGELGVWPLAGWDGEDDEEEDEEEDDDDNVDENQSASVPEQSEEASAAVSSSSGDSEGAAANSGVNEDGVETEKNPGAELDAGSDGKAQGSGSDPSPEPQDDMPEEANEQEEAAPAPPPLTPDEFLHLAVCRALVNLGKNDLPMSVGTFYTKHVVPQQSEGIDSMADVVKRSSYKKFGNYLKRWQIRDDADNDDGEDGLVRTGPDPSNRNNKDPNALLLFFDKRHPDLRGIKKTKKGDSGNANDKPAKLMIVTLHVVPQNWTKLLRLDPDAVKAANASSEARKGTGMLTMPEVRKLLDDYLQRESLPTVGKKVLLDGPLTDALRGKSGSSDSSSEEAMSKKDLYKRFADRMSPAFGLVAMPGSHVLRLRHGKPPSVHIEVIRRQSKKFVTKLRGLEEYFGFGDVGGIEPAVFCKLVCKRLAISGTLDTDAPTSNLAALARRKGHVEYNFGANIADELKALLTGDETLSDHGGVKGGDWPYPCIPEAVIDVVLRKGVPAGKKRVRRINKR